MTWIIPEKNKEEYLERCEYYATHDFSNFKQDKKYTTILEGNEEDVAIIAYKSISCNDGLGILKENFEKFKENESVGNPTLININGIKVAPSTLRYVNSAIEIKNLVKDPKKIIEIGGGYGGLCKTMSVLFNWDSYKIVDLPEPVKLCNKYLKHFNLNAEAVEKIDEECDLLIADSSVAECDWETQQEYLKVINKAKYAYIVYNTLFTEAGRNLFDLFIGGLKDFTIKSEHPLHHLDGRIVGHIKILYLKKNEMA